MRMVPSLHPMPSQTGANPWQFQRSSSYPQGSPVLVPQEIVQLARQRAREAVNVQRETSQQGELLAATHPYAAIARHRILSALARNDSEHEYDVQLQVRHLEHEADSRFLNDPRNC